MPYQREAHVSTLHYADNLPLNTWSRQISIEFFMFVHEKRSRHGRRNGMVGLHKYLWSRKATAACHSKNCLLG